MRITPPQGQLIINQMPLPSIPLHHCTILIGTTTAIVEVPQEILTEKISDVEDVEETLLLHTQSGRKLTEVYGDYVYQDDRMTLDGGASEDATW